MSTLEKQLLFASENGALSYARELITKGADVHANNYDGRTALH